MSNSLRRAIVSCALVPALLAVAGCDTSTPAPGSATPAAKAPAGDDARIGDRHGACLHLAGGDTLQDRRGDGDADTAVLRRGGGLIDVYAGPLPDFPGFRRVTRGLPDTPTPDFAALADTRENGRAWFLFGHLPAATAPRLYVMLSGAEAAFAGGVPRVLAC